MYLIDNNIEAEYCSLVKIIQNKCYLPVLERGGGGGVIAHITQLYSLTKAAKPEDDKIYFTLQQDLNKDQYQKFSSICNIHTNLSS